MYKITEVDNDLKTEILKVRAEMTKGGAALQDAFNNLLSYTSKRDILIYTDFNTGRVIDEFEVKSSGNWNNTFTKTHFECLEELEDTDVYVIEYKTVLETMGN